jgi:hypothetical protein
MDSAFKKLSYRRISGEKIKRQHPRICFNSTLDYVNSTMKQKIILTLFLVVGCIILSGCTTSGGDKGKFIGSWNGKYSWAGNFTRRVPATITFYSDGTYLATLPLIHDNGTWDVASGKLMKTAGNNTMAYTYTFSKDDTALIMTSTPANDLWNLTKQ